MNERTDIFLGYTSALLCWQVVGHKGLVAQTRTGVVSPLTAASNVRTIKELGVLDANYIKRLGLPLDVLVPSRDRIIRTGLVRCHVCTNELPPGGLRNLSPGVFVTSPAVTFVQMGTLLSDAQLTLVALQLLGTYLVAGDRLRAGLRYKPLTTMDELRAAAKPGLRLRGAGRARRVLDWCEARSNSPRESLAFVHLCLPWALGAYALPHPELNPAIELGPAGKAIARTSVLHPDLCWRGRRLIIEYNSRERHSSERELQDDERRAEAFRADGWTVVMLRGRRLEDPLAFDDLVRNVIAPCLGVSIPARTQAFMQARSVLCAETLSFDPYDAVRARDELGRIG